MHDNVTTSVFSETFHFCQSELVQSEGEDVHSHLVLDAFVSHLLVELSCRFEVLRILSLFLNVMETSKVFTKMSIYNLTRPISASTSQEAEYSPTLNRTTLQQTSRNVNCTTCGPQLPFVAFGEPTVRLEVV